MYGKLLVVNLFIGVVIFEDGYCVGCYFVKLKLFVDVILVNGDDIGVGI